MTRPALAHLIIGLALVVIGLGLAMPWKIVALLIGLVFMFLSLRESRKGQGS